MPQRHKEVLGEEPSAIALKQLLDNWPEAHGAQPGSQVRRPVGLQHQSDLLPSRRETKPWFTRELRPSFFFGATHTGLPEAFHEPGQGSREGSQGCLPGLRTA